MPSPSSRLAPLALVLALACRSQPTAPDPRAAADMLAVIHSQEAAWNSGDIVAFMERGYWNSEELQFLSGGSWEKGYGPVLARYRARYASPGNEMGQLTFSELDAEMLGADVGVVRGRWKLDFSGVKSSGGLFTLILRRFPEGWRITSDHTSSAAPAGS